MRELLPLLLLAASACGGSGFPKVVDARDVAAASGAPRIRRIRDAGTAMVPRSGPIEAASDGIAGPGELLVIEGGGFGRQPTVAVGGRPAEVLARVEGDGVVVRVPGGVATGQVDVEVTTPSGTARLATPLRRLAVVLAGERLRFAAVAPGAVAALPGAIPIAGARAVRLDSTGGAALVLADTADGARIHVVDLGRVAPALLGSLPIPHRGAALAAAAAAPRVVVIGDGKLSIVDTTSLRRPVLFEPTALPKEVRGIRGAELSPDGKLLAVLLAEGNRVVALDVADPGAAPQVVSEVEVLPGERMSLVRDLAFSPDGQTLWIVSGASAETFPQVIPTRITAVRSLSAYADAGPETAARPIPVGPIRRMLSVWKTQVVAGAGAPIALSIGRAPDAAGSAIRSAPEAATAYVSAVRDALLGLRVGAVDLPRVKKLLAGDQGGMIARAELGAGGGPAATTAELLTAFAVPSGDRRAIALAVRAGETLELGVAAVPLDGKGAATFTALEPIEPSRVRPPFAIGDLALQP